MLAASKSIIMRLAMDLFCYAFTAGGTATAAQEQPQRAFGVVVLISEDPTKSR